MASSKKKKFKKKPQQVNSNTTKKPQKEGFFARRERLNKERERRAKVAAIEAERAAKLARRNEEKAYREKLSVERQQAKAAAGAEKTEKAVQSKNIVKAEPAEPFVKQETPAAVEPVTVNEVRENEPVTEPVPEPVYEYVNAPAAEPVEESDIKTVEESVFATVEEPAEESVIEPVETPSEEFVETPVAENNGGEADEKELAGEYISYSELCERNGKTSVCEDVSKLAEKPSAKKSAPGNRKKLILIIAIPIVLAGIIALIFFGTRGKNFVPEKAVLEYRGARTHPNTTRDISIDSAEEAKRVKLLNMKGDKKSFKFYCNLPDAQELEEWNTTFYPCFANSSDNNCDLIITIFDEDGELIYRSLGLMPGKYIPGIQLFGDRDYGTYKCRLCVAAYDTETFKNIGVQYKDFKLIVGIEGENETGPVSTEELTALPATEPATTVGATEAETTTAAAAEATTAATESTTAAAETVSAAS